MRVLPNKTFYTRTRGHCRSWACLNIERTPIPTACLPPWRVTTNTWWWPPPSAATCMLFEELSARAKRKIFRLTRTSRESRRCRRRRCKTPFLKSLTHEPPGFPQATRFLYLAGVGSPQTKADAPAQKADQPLFRSRALEGDDDLRPAALRIGGQALSSALPRRKSRNSVRIIDKTRACSSALFSALATSRSFSPLFHLRGTRAKVLAFRYPR